MDLLSQSLSVWVGSKSPVDKTGQINIRILLCAIRILAWYLIHNLDYMVHMVYIYIPPKLTWKLINGPMSRIVILLRAPLHFHVTLEEHNDCWAPK